MCGSAIHLKPLEDPEAGLRKQTLGEEIANSVSHGLGFIAVLVGTPFLLGSAARHGIIAWVVGVTVFSASMMFLYLASTLYHALPRGRAKHIFRIIEHIAIYFLIAGTYTPFCLGVLHGPWGWTLFGIIWGLTLCGVVLKLVGGVRFPRISTGLYLLMGWVVMIAAKPLWDLMPHMGFFWIALGGLMYTLGVVFFTYDHRWRYSHFIWHLFVLAGSTCHYFAVYWYAR
jgi:hemolysin III